MANAKRTDGMWHTVKLKLSENEANFLADLMQVIGGHPVTSRRRHADSIRQALKAVELNGIGSNDFSNDGLYIKPSEV